MTRSRETYIPQGPDVIEIQDPESTAVVYLRDKGVKFCVMAFNGKRVKPAFNFYYLSDEQRTAKIKDFFESVRAKEEDKRNRATEKKNFKHDLEIGTILVSSWGYDQTNIDFYEVVKVVGKKTVEVRELAQEKVDTGSMQGTCLPISGEFISDVYRRQVSVGNHIKIHSSSYPSVWDGRKEHYTSYA